MTDSQKPGHIEVLSLASLLAIAAVLSIFTVVNRDIGFHLQAGALIWDQGAIPTHDTFSYIAEGRRWVDSHWLFQLLIHAVHALAAAPGLVFMRTVLVLAVFGFLIANSLRRGATISVLGVGLLVMFTSYQRFIIRPELLSFLFLAIFVHCVDGLSRNPRRALIALPVIQVLWTNSHGFWVLGPAYLGLRLVGGLLHDFAERRWAWVPAIAANPAERKREGLLFGLCSLAGLVNANGIDGILYPAYLFAELLWGVAWFPVLGELSSPFSYAIRSPLQPQVFYWALVAICLTAGFVNRRNARLADWLPTLAFMLLSLRSIRNSPLFAIVAMGVTVENISCGWRAMREGGLHFHMREGTLALASLVTMLGLLGGVSAIAASDTLYTWLHWQRRFGVSESETYPAIIVERLRQTPGRFYNDTSMGGYLIWKLYPDKQVAIDGRWEVYGELIPRLDAAIRGPRAFAAFAEKYDVTAIALMPKSVRGRTMLRWLPNSREFKQTLKAPNVVLYEKIDAQTR